ncbi:hypothetical protein [Planomicrobium okeanokoites]|uniref:hypothetical protein n=1 Tax=Planomicrobium okeanokoites TaxID=244 RepID=UPI0035617E59
MLASAFFALFSQIKSFETTRYDRSEIISASKKLYRRSAIYIGVQEIISALNELYRRSPILSYISLFFFAFRLRKACNWGFDLILSTKSGLNPCELPVSACFFPVDCPDNSGYQRSGNYIDVQRNISTFKKLYQRSAKYIAVQRFISTFTLTPPKSTSLLKPLQPLT